MAMPTTEEVMTSLRMKLPQLQEGAFVLVTVPVDDVSTASCTAVSIMQEHGGAGVYVGVSRDYLSVIQQLSVCGADHEKLRYVDVVSRMYGIAPVDKPNLAYVEDPINVDAIVDAVAAGLAGLKGKRFVVLDSLMAVLLYGTVESTLRFTSSLQDLLRREMATGLVIVPYKEAINETLVSQIVKNGAEILTTAA